jgi:hypothetical protein
VPGEGEWVSKNGYPMDEVTSALQKAIRRGDEEQAGFWALEMVDSGHWHYMLYRLSVTACEDIGLADPMAAVLVNTVRGVIEKTMEAQRRRGWARFPNEMLGFLLLYLCRAPKSRMCDDYIWLMQKRRASGWRPEIPEYAKDEHTKSGRDRIRRTARAKGMSEQKVAEILFYGMAGLLKGGQKDVGGRNWSKELFDEMGLEWTGYELKGGQPDDEQA